MSQIISVNDIKKVPEGLYLVRWRRDPDPTSTPSGHDPSALRMLRWFRENTQGRVWLMSNWEQEDEVPATAPMSSSTPASAAAGIIATLRGGPRTTYYEVYSIWFEDPDEAVLFKLTHGIR